MLPKDMGEIDRLDVQHYVLRAILRGNYLAPIRAPRHILDVGCGTGQWAYEMAQEFPQAMVVGLDLEQIRNKSKGPPPNYRFVAANLLEGLPFANNTFDFVHQRLMAAALPLTAWPLIVRDLIRVTAPGGWVELVEGSGEVAPAGPATQEVFNLTSQLAALRGLDSRSVVVQSLERYLRDAGLINVERRFVDAPMGDWGGRIGALLALDFREAFQSMAERIAQRFQLPREAFEGLLQTMQRECNTFKTSYRFAIAYGQKP
jgi:ubiquinone/menaquinone biosynthesis C-methylase UbiE